MSKTGHARYFLELKFCLFSNLNKVTISQDVFFLIFMKVLTVSGCP